MSRAARAWLALASCALSSGCVAVGWGTYPVAHGAGVETAVPTPFRTDTRVETPEVAFEIELSGYEGTMAFLGVLVPVIPFWLPPDPNARLRVQIIRPPREAFALVSDGLPRVGFKPETRWFSEVWDEP